MTFTQFDSRLTTIIREAKDRAIETEFDELMHNYEKKMVQAVTKTAPILARASLVSWLLTGTATKHIV